MARAGTFSSLGTTQTTYFRAARDLRSPLGGSPPSTTSGIGSTQEADGVPTKGFRVKASASNTTNVIVYVNGLIAGYLEAGDVQEFITIEPNLVPCGVRLDLKAASGTVAGTFGTID